MAIDQDPRDYDCCVFIRYHIPDFYVFFCFVFYSPLILKRIFFKTKIDCFFFKKWNKPNKKIFFFFKNHKKQFFFSKAHSGMDIWNSWEFVFV